MISTASGRLALILTAGFFVSFAEPSAVAAAPAATTTAKSDTATSDKSVRQSPRYTKRHARKSGNSDAKASEARKTSDSAATSAVLPAAIADANARLTGDASVDVAGAASASAGTMVAAADTPAEPAAEADMVASDELNELDRAVPQSQIEPESQPALQQAQTAEPQTQTVAVAAPKAAPVLAGIESSSLDHTSLIGKIFIAVGTLLTMVSAARMFMA